MEALRLRSPIPGVMLLVFDRFVDRPRRRVAERLMLAPVVVEVHPVGDVRSQLADRGGSSTGGSSRISNRSMKTLSIQRPLPSMLIGMPLA